jgi:hypothetical protein
MQDQLGRLEVVATSPDRSVRVVAGAGGAVTDLKLSPDAMRLAANELAATIMTTLREAVAEAVRRQAGIVDETFGDAFGLNTADRVREAQELGTAANDLTSHHNVPSAEAAPRRPARRDDEDDFSQNSIY